MNTISRSATSRGVLAGLAVTVAAVLTACGGSSTSSPPAVSQAPASEAPASEAPASEALTAGIVNFDTTSITANTFATAAEAAMTAKGWEVLNQDPKGDAVQGNAICTQYVTRGVDAIVINIFESSQMAQCMSQAADANIPVFYIGSLLAEGMAGAVSTIVPQPINDAFLEYAKSKGTLNVLELTFQPGAPCRVREEELDKAVAASGLDLKVDKHEFVIPGQVTDAQAATQAWLTANPEAKGDNLAVWACFSDPAVGALAALNQAGRTGVPIFTWDFTKQTIDPIKNGEIAATLWVDPNGIAQQVIDLIEGQRNGEAPKQLEATNVVVDATSIDGLLESNPNAAQ